jgi:hypothetical protein
MVEYEVIKQSLLESYKLNFTQQNSFTIVICLSLLKDKYDELFKYNYYGVFQFIADTM